MDHEYNIFLVFLSILNAAMAAFIAFSIVDKLNLVRETKRKNIFLLIGAVSMGFGVWGMHFTAMQACDLGITISYDFLLTLISILPAIIGCFFVLKFMTNQHENKWKEIQINSFLMAVGIGCMHFIGMEAVIVNAKMGYDPMFFCISIITAHILAMLSLYTKKIKISASESSNLQRNVICALLMGAAISGMHYVAMHAVKFVSSATIINQATASLPPILLSVNIFLIMLVLLFMMLFFTSVENAYVSNHSMLETIISTMPIGLLVLSKNGLLKSSNEKARKHLKIDSDSSLEKLPELLRKNKFKEIVEEISHAKNNIYHQKILDKEKCLPKEEITEVEIGNAAVLSFYNPDSIWSEKYENIKKLIESEC